MEVVDVVQKCVNLMESIYWSQLETRAYRTHCHDITLVVCKLWPTLVEALQQRNPNLCEVPGAEYVRRYCTNLIRLPFFQPFMTLFVHMVQTSISKDIPVFFQIK